jgi:ankyrin repeat protein
MSQDQPSPASSSTEISSTTQEDKNLKKRKREVSPSSASVEGSGLTESFSTLPLSSSSSYSSVSFFGPSSVPETKEAKVSDEDLATVVRLSGKSELEMWRTAVLSLTPVEEIAKLVSVGFDLNLALHAAMTQQFVMMTQQHQDSIINALLAHANINHLATAVADGKIRLTRLLATHLGAKGRLDDPIPKGEYTGASVLCMAADMGLLPMVQILLAAGAKPNTASPVKGTAQTAFKIATEHGYWEIVEELLKAGVSVHTKWSGVTAIYSAAAEGHLALVKLLIAAGADCITPLGEDAASQQGCTPLFIAAANGHGAVVRALAEDKSCGGVGAPHNQAMTSGSHAGKTPLMIACERGHKSVVRALFNLGVTSEELSFREAIAAAKRGDHTAIVEALEQFARFESIAREMKVSMTADSSFMPNYQRTLYDAQVEDFLETVAKNDRDRAKRIIASSRRRKMRSEESYAMERLFGHKDMIELSLDSVKKLHDLVDDLVTNPQALRLATIIKYIRAPEVFHFLCNWGWSIHARNKNGNMSAILAATETDMSEVVRYEPVEERPSVRITPTIIRLLLNRGANPSDKNPLPQNRNHPDSYATPLQMTAHGKGKDNETIALTLVNAGANVDESVHVKNSSSDSPLFFSGFTALLDAVREGKPKAIKMLIALNANIYNKTDRGSTVWDFTQTSENASKYENEDRLQIKGYLESKDIDNWRNVAAVLNPAYACGSIQLLLETGAKLSTIIVPAPTLQDPTRISTAPQTALYWLIMNHPDGLKIFSPQVLHKYRSDLLCEAARHGNIKLLEYAISQITLGSPSLDADTLHSMGNAVYCAAKYGHHQAIAMLIDAGAPVNEATRIRDSHDIEDKSAPARTPLCAAARFGHARAVELLMRRTKKLNEAVNTLDAPLSLDTHPLALAAAGGHLAVVKLLLTANPKVDARVAPGATALANAAKRAIQYPSVDTLAIIRLLLAAGADRTITYIDPALNQRKPWEDEVADVPVAIIDIPNRYTLISEHNLARPLWSHSGESATRFYEEVRACLRLPVEEQLHKLLGDFLARDLIIKVLTAKAAFPPGYTLNPPQGNLPCFAEAPAPATTLRELLGLVASHYPIASPPLYGKMYHEDLVVLSETLPDEDDSPVNTLSREELTRLEEIIAKLHGMHLQLLAPEAARFQATVAKSDDKPKPPENNPTTTRARSPGIFQPAGLPAAPSNQQGHSASSSVSTLTPMDLDL